MLVRAPTPRNTVLVWVAGLRYRTTQNDMPHTKSDVYVTESLWWYLEECDRVLTVRGHMCVKEKQLSVKKKKF